MTPTGAFCNICSKRFSSTKAAENHLGSRRHIDRARDAEAAGAAGRGSGAGTDAAVDAGVHAGVDANVEEDEDEMELEARLEDGGTPFPPSTCVFDGKACASVEANLAHMASAHGFFMPYVEHLVDAPGLLSYLGEKVGLGYACVACDRPFTSVEAVQRHMVDKAHMRMVDDDERWVDEYAPFFSADGDEQNGEVDAAADGEDGEWEEVEDDGEAAELLEAAGLSAKSTTTSGVAAVVELAGGGGPADRQVVATADAADAPLRGGADVGEVMDKITSSLVLPNGRVLGHRDLARYYKQRPAPAESRDAAIARRTMRSSVLNNYQRLGWAGRPRPRLLPRTNGCSCCGSSGTTCASVSPTTTRARRPFGHNWGCSTRGTGRSGGHWGRFCCVHGCVFFSFWGRRSVARFAQHWSSVFLVFLAPQSEAQTTACK
eukprot:TRINITY_DN3672_c0_g1_i4.p1 TRINITY_DN3672_c0_g1~~TRINITY_DN3672_c0_g1_i4.p1  ORF type:complete len:432 (+),score=105.47 TRINITY_DN3672_c0_g1_i4:285-1580(+)